MSKKLKLILVEGGSLFVQEIIDRLEEFRIPVEKISLYSESKRVGEIHESQLGPLLIGNLNDLPESMFDLVVLLSPIKDLESMIRRFLHKGIPIIDASGSLPPSDKIPILFPENVKPGQPLPPLSILPSVIGQVSASVLGGINSKYQIEKVWVSAVQGASQYGSRQAMEELFNQAKALLSFETLKHEIFPKQIAFNVFSATGIQTLEDQLVSELRELFRREHLSVSMDVYWSGVFVGLAGTIWIETSQPMKLKEVLKCISVHPSVKINKSSESVGLLDAVGGDTIIVSGVRINETGSRGLTLRFAADNLRRGFSTHLIQILEIFNQ